jgi:DNA-binding transcriptional MerR regulator
MLKIGAFSRRGRVSVKVLRHYEAIGLLKPAHIDGATGYRSYEPSQLDDLHRLSAPSSSSAAWSGRAGCSKSTRLQ